MIDIQNLNFSYNKQESLFSQFSLFVPEGSVFGLLGPNGSGKTTLMRLILDLLHKESGEIKIFNETNLRSNTKLRSKIGALIESPSLYGHLTGKENLQLFAKIYKVDDKQINNVLDLVNLGKAADKKFKRYSLGMKQRLAIASTLLHNPPLIMLDEPMNGLDPQGMHDMRKLIEKLNKEEGKTIFISSHILSEIESSCSHIGIIKNGKCIFSGETNALKNQMQSNRKLIINTENPNSAFEKLKDAYKVEIHKSGIALILDKEASNSEIIKQIISLNIPINEAYNESNKLETLFLELTK